MHNVGDESILQAIVSDVRRVAADAKITVLTWAPEETSRRLDVRAVKVTVTNTLKELWETDVLLCGGGAMLAPYYNSQANILEQLKGTPGFPLTMMMLAKIWRKKVMVYAIGVEPIASFWFRQWAARSPNLVDVFTVRDEASKQLLESWGGSSRIKVVLDPAFGLSPPPSAVTEAFIQKQGLSLPDDVPTVGMSFAYEPGFVSDLDAQVDFLADLAKRLIAECDAYIVMIPMNTKPTADRQGLNIVAQRLPADSVVVLTGDYVPSQVIGLASRLDLVLSSRMHLLIFAAIVNTPFAALSRGPKIDAFAKRLGTEPIAYIDRLDVHQATEKTKQILQSSSMYRERMLLQLARSRPLLGTNQKLLEELLATCHK
jgi:polysaccharide pyruvyl transferase WcaK-like protein